MGGVRGVCVWGGGRGVGAGGGRSMLPMETVLSWGIAPVDEHCKVQVEQFNEQQLHL